VIGLEELYNYFFNNLNYKTMLSVIKSCNCKDEQQDQIHGKGNRVHNLSADGKRAYCTTCSPTAKTVAMAQTKINPNPPGVGTWIKDTSVIRKPKSV